MKSILVVSAICIALLLSTGKSFSQVAINTDGSLPNNSAMLDVKSTGKGVLITRLTTAQRNAISNPANGLMVFDMNTGSFWYYYVNEWLEIPGGNLSNLSDTDGDTKIEVEKTSDEDIIRFSTAGTERMTIEPGRIKLGLLNNNTIIGENASLANLTGNTNTVIGYSSFGNYINGDLDGSNNIVIGDNSLNNFESGNHNIAIGSNVMNYKQLGSNNIALGQDCFNGQGSSSGNIAIGVSALSTTTYGDNNISIGNYSCQEAKGSYNVCIGEGAGATTWGGENILIGHQAGASNYSGSNIFIGSQIGLYDSGGSNTIIGNHAAKQPGSLNTIIGREAGNPNIGNEGNCGYENVYIGDQAGYSSSYSQYNTFIGKSSGYSNSGESNVFLGYHSGANETGSNKLYISNSDTSTPLIYGEFDNSLLKFNGQVNVVNHDVYINDNTKGIIMTSPNGQCWQVKVLDNGSLSTIAVTCP